MIKPGDLACAADLFLLCSVYKGSKSRVESLEQKTAQKRWNTAADQVNSDQKTRSFPMTKPVVLCILDGWGLSETQAGNAPALARYTEF